MGALRRLSVEAAPFRPGERTARFSRDLLVARHLIGENYH
jgi:hypothetical protein